MIHYPIPDPIGGPLASSEVVRVSKVAHAPIVDHGITVDPHATVAQVSAALATLPADAFFAEHFGDVEVTLVFREPSVNGGPLNRGATNRHVSGKPPSGHTRAGPGSR